MTDLIKILPFCKDINNMIIQKVKPYRFEIGSYYRYLCSGYYKIIKITKCFIHYYYVICETDEKSPYITRRKLRYDKYNNEYFCLDTFFLNEEKYCVFAKNKKVFE